MMMVLGVSLVLLGMGYLVGLAWWHEGRRGPVLGRSLAFWLVAPGFLGVGAGIAFILLSLAILAIRWLP